MGEDAFRDGFGKGVTSESTVVIMFTAVFLSTQSVSSAMQTLRCSAQIGLQNTAGKGCVDCPRSEVVRPFDWFPE